MHLGPKKVSFSESPYFHHCTGHKDSDVRNHIIMTIYTIPTFPTTDFDLKQLYLWSWRYGCFKQGTRREVNLLFTISNLLLERQHWWNITGHDRDMLIVALAYYQHYLGIQFPFRTWRDRSYIMGHEKRDDGGTRYLWHPFFSILSWSRDIISLELERSMRQERFERNSYQDYLCFPCLWCG